MNKKYFVYFIGPEDLSKINYLYNGKQMVPVKIGLTSNIENRFSQLQTGAFFTLKVLKLIGPMSYQQAQKLEQDLHKVLEKFNTSGEWFYFNQTTLKSKKVEISSLIGTAQFDSLYAYIPIAKRGQFKQRNTSRLNWETIQFRNNCLRLKQDREITNELFWAAVEGNNKKTGQHFPKFKYLSETDRLGLAVDILGKSYLS